MGDRRRCARCLRMRATANDYFCTPCRTHVKRVHGRMTPEERAVDTFLTRTRERALV